ncbi:pentapeptide repeat-containing protein [Enterobacter asburiae]|uniref:pentapeptide repeat-containing protein n=1 Tax=Enterobacter asburiae TaxID=61645 RepID=UPI002003C6A3|nr:pentapeptide repeat-containing protein [Enterobacter asburiae]MCK7227251.1 pentapeptide repeat-containing protein [Enterobacter asburiae]
MRDIAALNNSPIQKLPSHSNDIAKPDVLQHVLTFFPGANSQAKQPTADEYAAFSRAIIAGNLPDEEMFVITYCDETITFRLPGKNHNTDGPVIVETSAGQAEVNSETYLRLCSALLLRDMGGLNSSLPPLDLDRIDLRGANLCNEDLKNLNLHNALLSCADLSGADLSGSDLSGTLLCGANLRGANLRNTNLSESFLDYADLSDADLTGATIRTTCLRGTNLCNARCSGFTPLPAGGTLLKLPNSWLQPTLTQWLDPIESYEGLLTTIGSINDSYPEVKLQMARELLTSLDGTNITSIAEPLLEAFVCEPFCQDTTILKGLTPAWEQVVKSFNSKKIGTFTSSMFMVSAWQFTQNPKQMLMLNGIFNQMMYQAVKGNAADKKAAATAMYDLYLQQEAIQPFSQLDDFGGYGTYSPDWNDPDAANFILRSPHEDGPVMLISFNTFHGMRQPKPDNPVWNHFYLFNSQQEPIVQGSLPLEDLFRDHFPLFYKSYQKQLSFNPVLTVLKTLPLGDLEPFFINATRTNVSTHKMVDLESQLALSRIFSPLLSSSADQPLGSSLAPHHYEAILDAFSLDAVPDAYKAPTFFSLAVLFTRYSSSAVFGTEHESPEIVRQYAYALMEKAYHLDRSLFTFAETDLFPDWKNRLLGLDGAFSCTAVLTEIMLEMGSVTCRGELAAMVPHAWR